MSTSTKVSRGENEKESDDTADEDNVNDDIESDWNMSIFDFQINQTYTTHSVIFIVK